MNLHLTVQKWKMAYRKNFFLLTTVMISISCFGHASPNDPRFATQWYLEQASDVDIDYDEARTLTASQPKSEVVVAVLDSAMDTSHADLVDRLWKNPNEYIDGVDNDNDHLIDNIHGWDFRNNDNDVFDQVNPHATSIAGIIAATTDNSYSISGVAGDFPIRIMPLQIVNTSDVWERTCQSNFEVPTFDENLILGYAFINAFNYAIDHGADIINTSLGFQFPDNLTGQQLQKALQLQADFEYSFGRAEEKGILIVIAAGNSNNHYYFNPEPPHQLLMDYIGPVAETYIETVNGASVEKCRLVTNQQGERKLKFYQGVRPEIPAMFAQRYRNIIPVASINEQGNLASWLVGEYIRGESPVVGDHSAYGDIVLMAAPGTNIQSTWPLNDWNALLPLTGANSGTSFAAPMVTGAMAMVLSLHPELRISDSADNAARNLELLRDILIHGIKPSEELAYNAEINAPLVASGGFLHLPTLLNYADTIVDPSVGGFQD